MKEDEDRDIEVLLKSIKLKPAPAGLRDKVLSAARQARTRNRVMTPLLWRWTSCCVLVIAVVLGLDASLAGKQAKHLQSYLGGRQLSRDTQDTSWPELARDLDESADSKLFVQVTRQTAAQRRIQSEKDKPSLAETSQEVY